MHMLPLGPPKWAARYLWRRRAYQRYLERAADRLARELQLPSELIDHCLKRAGKLASKRHRRERWEEAAAGGGGKSPTVIDETAVEFPGVLFEALENDFRRAALPPREQLKTDCARAIRACVANTENDGIARYVLEQEGGSAVEVRKKWSVVTAAVTTSAFVGLAVGLGLDASSSSTTASIISGLAATATVAASVTAIVLGTTAADLRRGQSRLRELVDALLAPKLKSWEPRDWNDPEPSRPQSLAARIGAALTEIESHANREFLCRWDGSERDAIDQARKAAVLELESFLNPKWEAFTRLQVDVAALIRGHSGKVARAGSDPAAVELELGKLLVRALVCCAAVASVLDDALGAFDVPIAA